MTQKSRTWNTLAAALCAAGMTVACGDDGGSGGGGDGGNGGGDGGNLQPISIPAGMNIATMTVSSSTVAVAPAVPTGSYQFESIGFAPQRNQDEFYANFGESGPSSVLRTLNFTGLHRVGTFACGARAKPNDDYAIQTGIDLKDYEGGGLVIYDSKAEGSSCEVTVTLLNDAVIEGRYSGTLVNTTTPSSKITLSGEFRSHKP